MVRYTRILDVLLGCKSHKTLALKKGDFILGQLYFRSTRERYHRVGLLLDRIRSNTSR